MSQRIREQATYFLEKHLLPAIEKRAEHEQGWTLSYYGMTRIGKLVRACKYENGGPFPAELVERAVEVLCSHYPVGIIGGIVSVPPTRSGKLVENFARQVAASLSLVYIPAVVKIRTNQPSLLAISYEQ